MVKAIRKADRNSSLIPIVGLIKEYFRKRYPANTQNKICAKISRNLFINYSLANKGDEVKETLS